MSGNSVRFPTAAMMFCLCTTIDPAVSNGDESVNRLRPTDADNYYPLVATVLNFYKHTGKCCNL